MPGGRGMGFGLGSIVLLGGAAMVLQNSLFNVDGGHRAIKYRRISGVGKDIYSEGKRPSPRHTRTCPCACTRNYADILATQEHI